MEYAWCGKEDESDQSEKRFDGSDNNLGKALGNSLSNLPPRKDKTKFEEVARLCWSIQKKSHPTHTCAKLMEWFWSTIKLGTMKLTGGFIRVLSALFFSSGMCIIHTESHWDYITVKFSFNADVGDGWSFRREGINLSSRFEEWALSKNSKYRRLE